MGIWAEREDDPATEGNKPRRLTIRIRGAAMMLTKHVENDRRPLHAVVMRRLPCAAIWPCT